jgi:hypothetical protein
LEAGEEIIKASTIIRETGTYLATGGKVMPTQSPNVTSTNTLREDATTLALQKGAEEVGEAGVHAADKVEEAFKEAVSGIRLDLIDLGGSVMSIFTNIANDLMGSLLSKIMPISGSAGGGRVQAGSPILVGERGMEAIVASRPATTGGAHGGLAGKQQNIDIVNHFPIQPLGNHAEMIESALPDIEKSIEEGLRQAMKS